MVQAETILDFGFWILDFGFWILVKISNLKEGFNYGVNQNTYILVIIDTNGEIKNALTLIMALKPQQLGTRTITVVASHIHNLSKFNTKNV